MSELRIRGNCSQLVLGHLQQAKEKPSVTRLTCLEVDFDDTLLKALEDLLTNDSSGRTWERIRFRRCSGPICEAMTNSNIAQFDFFDLDENPFSSPSTKFQILSNSTLLRVSFENLRLSTDDAICLSRGLATNTTLHSFGLNESSIDTEACHVLSQQGFGRNKTLRTIKITDCGISDQAIVAIVNKIRTNPSLRELSLSGNRCRSGGLAAVTNLLNEGRLIDLDFSHQQFEQEQDEESTENNKLDILDFLYVLRENQSLKRLAMRECNLSDDDLAQLVSQVFVENRTLQDVDLRWNRFTAERGFKSYFAANLRNMHGLKRIQLRQGHGVLHEDIRDALVDGLTHNMTLESIDVFGWDKAIEHLCDLNRAYRVVLKDGDFPIALWPQLFVRAQSTIQTAILQDYRSSQPRRSLKRKSSALYYFLRYGPLLMERWRQDEQYQQKIAKMEDCDSVAALL